MESFWGLMQIELLDRRTWTTRAELAGAMFEWIEAFYNPVRRHSALRYRSRSSTNAFTRPQTRRHDHHTETVRETEYRSQMATWRRRPGPGVIVHSDRGSQFRSRKFVHALNRHGLVGSMGRVGAAGDNAAMESFFALLQKNVLDRRTWATREELRIAIVTWIERTYHRRRRQDALGRLTPIEYETIMTTPAAQAA